MTAIATCCIIIPLCVPLSLLPDLRLQPAELILDCAVIRTRVGMQDDVRQYE
jgi:hypothetical protein